MNTSTDIYKFNSNALENITVTNSMGSMGKRVVTLKDQNNHCHIFSFDDLLTLSGKKIAKPRNPEEALDACIFFERVVVLERNSRQLTSLFDRAKDDEIEKIYLAKNATEELLNLAKKRAESNPQPFGIDININLVDYEKLNEYLNDLYRYYSGCIDVSLFAENVSSINTLALSGKYRIPIPNRNEFIRLLEIFGKHVKNLKIPEIFHIDELLASMITVHCPNLITLPQAFVGLEDQVLYELASKLKTLISLPEAVKDRFINHLEQLIEDKTTLSEMQNFVSENWHILQICVQIDVTDAKNASRREKITYSAKRIKEDFDGDKNAEILSKKIHGVVNAAFFDVSDLAIAIFSHPLIGNTLKNSEEIKKYKQLGNLNFVSKSFQHNVGHAIASWRQQNFIQIYESKTADETVEYIKKFQLSKVKSALNFENKHLKDLAGCNIRQLIIGCPDVTVFPKMESLRSFSPYGIKVFNWEGYPNLQEINQLPGCLSDANLSALVKACPNLKKIDLKFTEVTNKGLAALLKACPHLQEISLESSQVTGEGLSALVDTCHNLEKLDLTRSKVTSKGFAEIVKVFPNLLEIILKETELLYSDLSTLMQSCPNIQKIHYTFSKDKNTEPVEFVNICHNLQEIDFSLTHLNDKTLGRLAKVSPNLKKIKLDVTDVTDKGLIKLVKACPHIQTIKLSSHATDDFVAELVKSCLNIKEINLKCTNVTDKGYIQIANTYPNLERINFTYSKITDEGLSAFLKLYSNRIKIDLSGIKITDKGLVLLGKACPQLQEIKLSYDKITDLGFELFAKACPNLREVNLYETKITDKGFTAFFESCPNLYKINLAHAGEVTKECVVKLHEKYQNVRITHEFDHY